MLNFQILEHPTDLKLKISASNLAELFKNAALAVFKSIDKRKKLPIASGQTRKIQINSIDVESLLVDWLNELLSLHDIKKENYFNIKIRDLTATSLIAEVKGAPSVQDKLDVKAATYHDLKIKKTGKGYEAVVLFDI